MRYSPPRRRCRGFTLIELILALGLSTVLLALLGSALSLGVSRAVGSRKAVETARLTDGIIALVRSDLHRAVIYNPQDTSGAMELAEASAGFDVDSIDEAGSGGGGGSAGSVSGTGSGTGGDSAFPLDGADGGAMEGTESVSLRRPLGVYGTLDELQVDVLREHSQYEIDESGNVIAPTATSGITTVRYALAQGTPTLGLAATLEGQSSSIGLVREEASRDLLNWANQSGTSDTLLGEPQLIAPEVSRLEFRYFDGVQLLDTWDSQALGGQLPLAIEVRIWFHQEGTEESSGRDESPVHVVTVALPTTWNALDASIASATSGATTSGGSSSSSSGTSSSAGGGSR